MSGTCIFCKSTGPFTTKEHILPESLGGGDWAILRNGLFCDRCQNKFGSSVEKKALADYPFSYLRTFLGIPTKKRKLPWFKSFEGSVHAHTKPGQFEVSFLPAFEGALASGKKTQMRLLAEPKKPDMICRMLLKMGLQVVSADNDLDVFHPKFDAARTYALTGRKSSVWWYYQHEDMALCSKLFRREIPANKTSALIALEVVTFEDNVEMFHLKLFYLDFIIPLDNVIPTDLIGLKEPRHRLFQI